MKPVTREWVEKAEGDFTTAAREFRARKSPNYDAACFHAQQCAEKYLKACLQEANVPFEKTHNLLNLLDKTLTVQPMWEILRPSLKALNTFAVEFRYPGENADKIMAKNAVSLCRQVRKQARLTLGLK